LTFWKLSDSQKYITIFVQILQIYCYFIQINGKFVDKCKVLLLRNILVFMHFNLVYLVIRFLLIFEKYKMSYNLKNILFPLQWPLNSQHPCPETLNWLLFKYIVIYIELIILK